MNTGQVGSTISAVSPALAAIPYVGPILSAAGTIAGGALQASEAKKQAQRAQDLRTQGRNIAKEPLREEYLQSLRSAKFQEQAGLPAAELWKNYLDSRLAGQARAIRESSPSGQATLEALSMAYGQNANSLNDLAIKNAGFRSGAQKDVRDMLWGVGGEQRKLELEQTRKRENLYAGANALENAATANKMNAVNQITGAIGSTGTAIANNIQTDNSNKMWADYLKGLTTTGNQPTLGTDANGNLVSKNPFASYTPTTNYSTPLWQQMNGY